MDVKEILSKMKPEHSAVIQKALDDAAEGLKQSQETLATVTKERDTAREELDKANSEIDVLKAKEPCTCDGEADEDGKCKVCGRIKKSAAFDETETMKSMPKEVREMFEKMKIQKEAAEEEVRKAKEAEQTAEAVAKAKELKAIPVEQDRLVGIIKSASPDLLDLLTVVNAAIEGTVLDEVGKSNTNARTDKSAWDKIEAKADEIAKRDSITKAKAISRVIKEHPDLYKEYLNGGAN
jgi:F0F1-type ATP synthase membrane subunit b/b'